VWEEKNASSGIARLWGTFLYYTFLGGQVSFELTEKEPSSATTASIIAAVNRTQVGFGLILKPYNTPPGL
jgi:hypothetical protein